MLAGSSNTGVWATTVGFRGLACPVRLLRPAMCCRTRRRWSRQNPVRPRTPDSLTRGGTTLAGRSTGLRHVAPCGGRLGNRERRAWIQHDFRRFERVVAGVDVRDLGNGYAGSTNADSFAGCSMFGRIAPTAPKLHRAQPRNFSRWRMVGNDIRPQPRPNVVTYERGLSQHRPWFSNRRHAWCGDARFVRHLACCSKLSDPSGLQDA